MKENGAVFSGIRQGRYTVAERTNVIMEVKRLHRSGVLQQKHRQDILSSDSSNGLSVPPEYTYSSDSSNHFSPDLPRGDEVFTPPNCSPSPLCSNGSPSCSSVRSTDSLNSKDSSFVIDLSEEVIKHVARPCSVEQRLPCGSESDSSQEARKIIENLIIGYSALKPFEKSLNDDELEKLFEEGFVS